MRLGRLGALSSVVVFVGCGSTTSRDIATPVSVPVMATAAQPLDDFAESIALRVNVDTCDGSGSGSGFVGPDGTVITNRHVVDGATSISVETAAGERWEVTTAETAVAADLARLRVPGTGHPPVAGVAPADARSGTSVRVIGFPRGGPVAATVGRVVDVTDGERDLGGAPRTQRISAVVEPGNSGGPLLDADGHVVGIVYAVELATGHGLVIPASEIKSAMSGRWIVHESPSC